MATSGSVGGDLTGGLTTELKGLVELLHQAQSAMSEFGNTSPNLERMTAQFVTLQREVAELQAKIIELGASSPKAAATANSMLASKGITNFSVDTSAVKSQADAEVQVVAEGAEKVRSVRSSAAAQERADLKVATAERLAAVRTAAEQETATVKAGLDEQRAAAKVAAEQQIADAKATARITQEQGVQQARIQAMTQRHAISESNTPSAPTSIGGNLMSGFTRNPDDPLGGVSKTIGRFLDYAVVGGLAYGLTSVFAEGAKDIVSYQDALTSLQLSLNGFNGSVDTSTQALSGMLNQLMEVSRFTGDNVSTAVVTAAKGIAAFGNPGDASMNAQNQQIGVGFAKTTTQLAAMTGQTQADNSGDLIAVASAYGLAATQFQQVIDAFATEHLVTGSDMAQATQGLSMFSSTAASAGINLNSAAMMMSLLTSKLNESGQTAATRMAAITQTLTGTTGRSVIAQINQLVDPKHQINTQADANTQLQQLAHAMPLLDTSEQQLVQSKIGGTRQGREFNIVMQYADQIFGTGNTGGAGQSQFDEITKNIKNTLTQIHSDVSNIIVSLSNTGVFDAIGVALKVTEPVLNTVNELLEAYNKIPFHGWLTNLAMLAVAYNAVTGAMAKNAAATAAATAAKEADAAAAGEDAAAQGADALATNAGTVAKARSAAATTATNLKNFMLNPNTLGNTVARVDRGITSTAGGIAGTARGGAALSGVLGAEEAAAQRAAFAEGGKILATGFTSFMRTGLGMTLWATAGIVIASELISHANALTKALSDSANVAGIQVTGTDTGAYDKQAQTLKDQAKALNDASHGFWGTIVSWGSNADSQEKTLNDEADRLTKVSQAIKDARTSAANHGDLSNAIDMTSPDSVTSSLQALSDNGASATTQVQALTLALGRMGTQAGTTAANIGGTQQQQTLGMMMANGIQTNLTSYVSNAKDTNSYTLPSWVPLSAHTNPRTQAIEDQLGGLDPKKVADTASGVLTNYLKDHNGSFNPDDWKGLQEQQKQAVIALVGADKWKQFSADNQNYILNLINSQGRQALTGVLGYDPINPASKDAIKSFDAASVPSALTALQAGLGKTSQSASEQTNQAILGNNPMGGAYLGAQYKLDADKGLVQGAVDWLKAGKTAQTQAQAQVDKAQAALDNAKPGDDVQALKANLDAAQKSLDQVKDNVSVATNVLDSANKQVDADYVNMIQATSDHLTALNTLALSFVHDNQLATLQSQMADNQRIMNTSGINQDKKDAAQEAYNQQSQQYNAAVRAAGISAKRLNISPGDSLANAAQDLRDARDQITYLQNNGNAWNSPEMVAARRDLQAKQYAYDQDLIAKTNAQAEAQVFPGSALQSAAVQIDEARRAMQTATRGSAEWWAAYGKMQQAQLSYAQAQIDASNNSALLGLDLTNSVQTARQQVTYLQAQYNQLAASGAPSDVLNAKQVDLKKAQAASDQAAFQQQLSAMQTQDSLGQITHDTYMNWVQSERDRIVQRMAGMSALDNGYQQLVDERNQMDTILHDAAKSFTGQFNLGDVKLPSVYQAREALGLPGSGVGSSYNDNRTVTITVNGGDLAQVQSVIRDAIGAPAQSRIGTTVGRV